MESLGQPLSPAFTYSDFWSLIRDLDVCLTSATGDCRRNDPGTASHIAKCPFNFTSFDILKYRLQDVQIGLLDTAIGRGVVLFFFFNSLEEKQPFQINPRGSF